MSFYTKFIELCNQNGTTPTAVTESIGLNRSSATGWKKGFNPTDITLQKVADYFGVSVDVFAENEKDDDILQSINDEERALLHSYRTMTEEQKAAMKVLIKGIKGNA